MVKTMKKPKIKKRKNYFLVYREKIKAFKCYDKKSALMYLEILKNEYQKEKAARAGCFLRAA